MKKSISVSNLTLDLYLTYVRPAAIAAGILEEVPARDDWHEYTALHTDAAAADEIAHCMYCACMCAGNDGIERTHEEYIRHEAERMIGQLEVSIKYDLHNVADTLTALLAAMTEALHPTTPAEAAQAATEAPQADALTATEREALERINARQNAANLFTNIGPADIAREIETMNEEQKEEATPMRINICAINLNEGDGRQNISWDTADGHLYSDACEEPIDGYSYSSIEGATEAADMMWGSSDLTGAWALEWIERPSDDPEPTTAPAEEQPTTTENAPQAATQAAEEATTDEQKEEASPMFENLRNAVNAHYNQQAAEFAAKLETITAAEALKTWYYSDRMTPAALEMVKTAAAADQAATIPEAARAKMIKRYTNENEKNRARYLEKLDRAEAAEPLTSAAIVVDWTRSRTWGWNPTATVTVNNDCHRQTKGSASGCGYDKESAAICGAFNANPSIMRALYEHAEQGGKFPYSVNTYAGIPYFDGGCGVTCNYSVFEAMGYKFADVAHSRHGADVYSITRA